MLLNILKSAFDRSCCQRNFELLFKRISVSHYFWHVWSSQCILIIYIIWEDINVNKSCFNKAKKKKKKLTIFCDLEIIFGWPKSLLRITKASNTICQEKFPLAHFQCSTSIYHKTSGFLTFSEVIDVEHWLKMGKRHGGEIPSTLNFCEMLLDIVKKLKFDVEVKHYV